MTTPVENLPAPDSLAPAWSAIAAVLATRGTRWATGAFARGPVWHHDDGGGNWADLVRGDGGRAVLLGHDHEYSDTYFRESASYFGEPETDLLAGCPSWWGDLVESHLERIRTDGMWVGFVYGFDGARWSRADYDVDDGFGALNLPFLSRASAIESITDDLSQHCVGEFVDAPVDLAARVALLVDWCPALDAAVAARVFDGIPGEPDIDAAVAAARAFA